MLEVESSTQDGFELHVFGSHMLERGSEPCPRAIELDGRGHATCHALDHRASGTEATAQDLK